MTAYGYGVAGHERVRWVGTKIAPFSANTADRMAIKAIESAVRDAGYGCRISDKGARRECTINNRTLHNGTYVKVTHFVFESKRGGIVAVRIRKLAEQGVHPAQWVEHMPDVLRVEQHTTWSTGAPDELRS